MTLVSVVIPCYNQAQFLAEAVESVLSQDYPDKEIIVVNDGSPDNTRSVAAQFGNLIKYIEKENGGLSSARNTGIRAAKGDFVALLDCDDVCLDGRLKLQADYLIQHSDVGMVVSDALHFDGKQTSNLRSSTSGKPGNHSDFRWETAEYCMTPSTAMIRRSCFDAVGYFDERLRRAAEDWLFAVRLAVQYPMAYVDKPLILYRIHPESATANPDLVNYENRKASAYAIAWSRFPEYPAHFRAKLLYYRFATAWHSEPKHIAMRFFARALLTDPSQIPFGLHILRLGIMNAVNRRREGKI